MTLVKLTTAYILMFTKAQAYTQASEACSSLLNVVKAY
jgi:hypothetical protein